MARLKTPLLRIWLSGKSSFFSYTRYSLALSPRPFPSVWALVRSRRALRVAANDLPSTTSFFALRLSWALTPSLLANTLPRLTNSSSRAVIQCNQLSLIQVSLSNHFYSIIIIFIIIIIFFFSLFIIKSAHSNQK